MSQASKADLRNWLGLISKVRDRWYKSSLCRQQAHGMTFLQTKTDLRIFCALIRRFMGVLVFVV